MSWIDWEQANSPQGKALTEYVARVVALRKNYPVLRETRFLYGDREVLPGLYDVSWFDERGDRARDRSMAGPGRPRADAAPRGTGHDRRNGRDPADDQRVVARRSRSRRPRRTWNGTCSWIARCLMRRNGRSSAVSWRWRRTASSCCLRAADRRSRLAGRLDGGRASGAAAADGVAARSGHAGDAPGAGDSVAERARHGAGQRHDAMNLTTTTTTKQGAALQGNRKRQEIMSECPIDPHKHHYAYCLPFGAHVVGTARETPRTRYRFWAPSRKSGAARNPCEREHRAGADRHGAHRRRLVRSRSRWRRRHALSCTGSTRTSRCPIRHRASSRRTCTARAK